MMMMTMRRVDFPVFSFSCDGCDRNIIISNNIWDVYWRLREVGGISQNRANIYPGRFSIGAYEVHIEWLT